MFGLIRILLLLVIIAAVALLIRPDLIEMTGLAGSKQPQNKEKTASVPVAEQQVTQQISASATATETDSPASAEQAVEQTAEKAAKIAASPEKSIATEKPNAPQENDTSAESDTTQKSAPAHAPETLKQSKEEWGFDGSQEAISVPQNTPPEEIAAPQEAVADTAETGTPQESAPMHDPETLKQSETEWGFDGSEQATPDAENATPEASDTPSQSDTGTTESTPGEAALRREVAELQALAADIIANPEQR
jgi:competence protein ComGC